MSDVLHGHRVHVVDDDLVVDLETLDTKIVSEIARDDMVANLLPLMTRVERLVDIALGPEGRSSDSTSKTEIVKPCIEAVDTTKFSVGSNHPTHPLREGAARLRMT